VLKKRGGGLQFVSQLDGQYDPLHYVLLFPYGQRGWSLALKTSTGMTMNQFYRYHLMIRDASRVIQLSGRLTQEYVVDAYAKIEESRLLWSGTTKQLCVQTCTKVYRIKFASMMQNRVVE